MLNFTSKLVRRCSIRHRARARFWLWVMKVLSLITPHVSDVMDVIVWTSSVWLSVCVSVRLAIPAEWTDIRT